MARSRAKARLNFSAQGQRSGRCRVNRRAERVSRPAREKNRRRRVLVVAIRSPRPIRAVQRARLWAIVWTASQDRCRVRAGLPHGRQRRRNLAVRKSAHVLAVILSASGSVRATWSDLSLPAYN